MQQQEDRFWVLVAKYYGNEINSSEEAELFAVLAADPVKQKEFEQARLDWVEYRTSPVSIDRALWDTVRSRIDEPVAASAEVIPLPGLGTHGADYATRARPMRRTSVWMGVAAGVLLAVVSVYLLTGRKAAAAPDWTTYTAAIGKTERILLPDSSTVYLNAGSSLKYSTLFNDSNREIFVEGEAFFDVKKDAARPFIAHGGGLLVRVLGTSFDLKSFKGDVNASVSVASGKVSVSDSGKELDVLTADQSLVIDQQSHAWSRVAVDHHDMEWFNDRLAFVNLSFGDIAHVLERKYGVSVVFAHEDLRYCRYSAYFDHHSLQQILNQLSWTNQFNYKIKGKSILIGGKGCK